MLYSLRFLAVKSYCSQICVSPFWLSVAIVPGRYLDIIYYICRLPFTVIERRVCVSTRIAKMMSSLINVWLVM